MSELSPAAQAVFEAAWSAYLHELEEIRHAGAGPELIAAAALRAAAEQVPYLPKNCSSYDINVHDGREEVRSFLLTIVAELETQ